MHRTYLYLFKIMWVWLLFYVRFFVVFFTHHNIWLYGEKFVCVFFLSFLQQIAKYMHINRINADDLIGGSSSKS